jgi:hypothetical protein
LETLNARREFLISVDLRKAKAKIERHIVWDGREWKFRAEQATETIDPMDWSLINVSCNEDYDIGHNIDEWGYVERDVYDDDDSDQGDYVN